MCHLFQRKLSSVRFFGGVDVAYMIIHDYTWFTACLRNYSFKTNSIFFWNLQKSEQFCYLPKWWTVFPFGSLNPMIRTCHVKQDGENSELSFFWSTFLLLNNITNARFYFACAKKKMLVLIKRSQHFSQYLLRADVWGRLTTPFSLNIFSTFLLFSKCRSRLTRDGLNISQHDSTNVERMWRQFDRGYSPESHHRIQIQIYKCSCHLTLAGNWATDNWARDTHQDLFYFYW